MNAQPQNRKAGPEPGQSSLGLEDIYYVLFRRKWLVVIGAILGIVAAGAAYKLKKPLFQSQAKLLIKAIPDAPVLVTPGDGTLIKPPDPSGDKAMGSEREILQSEDIAHEVAEKVGPERILPKKVRNPNVDPVDIAAGVIAGHLKVDTPNRTDVLSLQFQHWNPDVPQRVLNELIHAYFKAHDRIHRGDGELEEEKLERDVKEKQALLTRIDDQLRQVRTNVGVVSIEEAKKLNIEQRAKIANELIIAESDLAARGALLDVQTNALPSTATTTSSIIIPAAPHPPTQAEVDEYRDLSLRIETIARELAELLSHVTPSNSLYQTKAAELQQDRAKRTEMERRLPGLVRPASPAGTVIASPLAPANDLPALMAQVRSGQARVQVLTNKLSELRDEAKRLDIAEVDMTALTRNRTEIAAQLTRLESLLERKRRIKELGDNRAPNISVVQTPSPAYRDYRQFYKKLGMMVAGGFGGGLALAFLMELVFNRALRRPKDVENALEVPLFVTVPALELASPLRSKVPNGQASELPASRRHATLDAARPDHALRPYHEALRDQLINYFEVREMVHKPKMIAVTSCANGAGVTSTAAGLAASLSETGDGNVLLVDMRGQRGGAHAFFNGQQACGIEEALEAQSRNNAQVDKHLYVVSTESADHKLQRILPRQFGDIVPRLKASDYDYIIFDMPPVAQTSITSKVARFMDMVLMVVESDKTDRDVAKRARALLAESKAAVATVLNKRKRYVPKWLLQEFP